MGLGERLVVVAGVLAVSAGLGPAARGPQATPVMSETADSVVPLEGVTISARFAVAGDRLEAHVRVTNGRAEDLYLIDTAFKIGPSGAEIRADHLEVEYQAPDTAILSSALPPWNPSIRWATPPTAYGSRVAPGATYENTLSSRLPLRPEGGEPRLRPDGTVAVPSNPAVICTHVRLRLGAVPHAPDLRAEAQTLAGKAMFQMQGAAAARRQRILLFEASNVAIPLIPPP